MNLSELCFHLRNRRGMYLPDGQFATAVAFIEGFNVALDGGLSLDQIPSDQDKPLTDDLVRLVDEFMNSSAAAAARHPGPTARPDPR
jgi:hypothetical protein